MHRLVLINRYLRLSNAAGGHAVPACPPPPVVN